MTTLAMTPQTETPGIGEQVATGTVRQDLGKTGWKVANISGGEMRDDLAKQWMARPADERFLNLTDLRDYTRSRYLAATESRIPNKTVEILTHDEFTDIEQTHELWAGLPDGSEVYLSNHAFNQISSLSKAPASYLRTLPSSLVQENLNWTLRRNREVEEVKAFYQASGDDGGRGLMHAMTGPSYGRIPDYEVVEAVQQIAGNGTGDARWKVPGTMDWRTMHYDPNAPITAETTTLYGSDRDVFMFLVDDRNPIQIGTVINKHTGTQEPDLVFRGFYVTNSEMGTSALKIAAFYLRAVCCNRLMWGVEGFKEMTLRHTSGAPDRFMHECRPALDSFANGSVRCLLNGVQAAKEARVANDDDEALQFLQARKLNKARAKKVLELVEEEEQSFARTAWDMAQGITALARSEPNTDKRMELERIGGQILNKAS